MKLFVVLHGVLAVLFFGLLLYEASIQSWFWVAFDAFFLVFNVMWARFAWNHS